MEVQTFLRFRFTRSSHVSCLSSSIRQLSAVLCLMSFLLVPHAGAAVRLAAPFTDGAVLQRGARVPVWGTAAPGEARAPGTGRASGAQGAGGSTGAGWSR